MLKNVLKDTHLSIIPTTLFLGVFLFVLIRFFSGDYYQIYTANLGNVFNPQVKLNLPSTIFNITSIELPYILTVDTTHLSGDIISARFFIDGKERNITETSKRSVNIFEEQGKRLLRFNNITVPFSDASDGRHSAKIIVLYGERINPKLAVSETRFSVDYTNPSIMIEEYNNDGTKVKVVARDRESGIQTFNIYVLNEDLGKFEIPKEVKMIEFSPQEQNIYEYSVQNLDPKREYIAFVLDRAENSEIVSLRRKQPLENQLEKISSKITEERIPQTFPNPENQGMCEISLKYYYAHFGAENFSDWWGINPATQKNYKEEIIELAHGGANYSMLKGLQRAIVSIQKFPYPTIYDFNTNQELSLESLNYDPQANGIQSGIWFLPMPSPLIQDDISVLDWNNISTLVDFLKAKSISLNTTSIVFVDAILNHPGFKAVATTLSYENIIIVDYLKHVEALSGNFYKERLARVLTHELGHTQGLDHTSAIPEFFENLMYPYVDEDKYSFTLDQAAAFMAHTQNCFDTKFQPSPAGVYSEKSPAPGFCKPARLLDEMYVDPQIQECDATFSNVFNPDPGATKVGLGFGDPGDPLAFCPIITDPSPTREVIGVTPENQHQLVAQYGPDKIRYCLPPQDPQACTCADAATIGQNGHGYVLPTPMGPGAPTGKGPKTPDSDTSSPGGQGCGMIKEKTESDANGDPVKVKYCEFVPGSSESCETHETCKIVGTGCQCAPIPFPG